jgi:hypothetical protein
MGYLTTLSVAQTIIPIDRITENSDLKRMGKESVVAYARVLTQDLPCGAEESKNKKITAFGK